GSKASRPHRSHDHHWTRIVHRPVVYASSQTHDTGYVGQPLKALNMSVRQKPAKFVTSDGEEFDTQSAAERHEELLTAERECEHAKARYSRALWRTQRTADDREFEPGSSREYWFLCDYFGMPEIGRA